MGILEVDETGLRALAAQAEGLESELAASSLSMQGSNPWQPSVVAVNAASALVSVTAKTLAGLMAATAEKLRVSSSSYTSQDERAASRIRTVEL